MITLSKVMEPDTKKIAEWIQADSWHRDDPSIYPEGFLTGQGLLAFCLRDEIGPLVFTRLDKDGDMARIAMQFGPSSEITPTRLVKGLIELGIPAMAKFARDNGFKGLIFESTSESLICFAKRQGFVFDKGDDYVLELSYEKKD
jgi:hypothetical protein